MAVYKHKNGIWYYKFVYKGRQYHKSTGLTNKSKAEAIEIRIKNDIITGKFEFAEDLGTTSFEKVCQEFEKFAEINRKSWKKSEIYVFRHLQEYFNKFILRDFTPFEIEKYKLSLFKEKRKPATINRNLDVLSAVMRYCVNSNYIKENPVLKVKKMKVQNNVERFLTEKEITILLKELSPSLRPLVITLLHLGCRKSEVLSLKWSSVDLKERIVTLYETKNGKKRKLYMSDTVYNILNELYKSKKQEYVFINPQTNKPFRDFHRGFKGACNRSNFTENTRIHDIRGTSATVMLKAGVDVYTVSEILGHSNIKITQRYLKEKGLLENKKNAVKALESFGDLVTA